MKCRGSVPPAAGARRGYMKHTACAWWKQGEFYGDITLDKAQAQALAAALEENDCEACHVPGILDDFLAGAQF